MKSGKVLAAVVIPPNIAARLGTGLKQAQLEVLYNGNALEQSLVQSQIDAALAQANIGFSEQIQRAASQAIGALLSGRNLGVLGSPDLIGLGQIPAKLQGIVARTPPGADRAALEQIESFARFASQNLGLAKNVLSTIGQPIAVKTTLISGRRTPLNTFAVVVAVSVSLMFVCVLLASGGVALEREEHTLARLVRGLTSRSGLLVEKALLAAALLVRAGLRDARGDRRVRVAGLGPLRAVAGGAGARRGGLRGARRGDRRARARGARGVAAGVPAVAAAGVPRARAQRRGRLGACTTRSAWSRSCSRSRRRCRRSTRRSTAHRRRSGCRWCTWRC